MAFIGEYIAQKTVRRLLDRSRQFAQLQYDGDATIYPIQLAIDAESKQRILVLTPHADDETFGAGGAIIQHIEAGHEVRVVLFSDNVASVNGNGVSPKEVEELRRAEFFAAMDVLGVKHTAVFSLSEEQMEKENDWQRMLNAILVENQPDVLYFPSLFDNHKEHRLLNKHICGVLREEQSLSPVCRTFEVWSPLPATAALNISGQLERKRQAIRCYKSQLSNIRYEHHIIGLNAYRALTFGDSAEYAEAFLELPATDYCALVRQFLDNSHI
ncbi:MAG: hypothetical protein CL946_09565 [Ectothiorhodospiraceae bacterium]|nr:hypothetical protein [Ectothiorhodospiraceae bacterium]